MQSLPFDIADEIEGVVDVQAERPSPEAGLPAPVGRGLAAVAPGPDLKAEGPDCREPLRATLAGGDQQWAAAAAVLAHHTAADQLRRLRLDAGESACLEAVQEHQPALA